jgi:hypothetical protein
MEAFAAAIGASYTPSAKPLSGKLQLADTTVLDCTVPEDQAFVAELVYKHAELQRALAATKVSWLLPQQQLSAALHPARHLDPLTR